MDKFRNSLLKKIYYSANNPGSLGGVMKLWNEAKKHQPKLRIEDVKNWLSGEDTYTLFRKAKRKFPRLKILVDRLDEQWQADLMDMSWFSKENDDVKYLLVVVDVFSRFAWVECLRNKNGRTVSAALRKIFSKGRKPEKLQTDQGKEFLNRFFRELMQEMKINHFTSTDDQIKCAIVERLNRTLRARIYRFIFFTNSNRYVDSIDDIVEGYNESFHRSIKTTPSEVSDETFFLNEQEKVENLGRPLKKGDLVRIQRKKGSFEKGATSNWKNEIFRITKIKRAPNTFIYRLEDLMGEPITSVHYPSEVMKVIEPKLYKIERIIKSRINPRTKQKELFVKWLGYSDKFNSWIDGR